MSAFLTPDTWDAWLTPEKLTGDRKAETLAMLEHTSSDVASTIREHIVDRKVSNSRTVDPTDPSLLESLSPEIPGSAPARECRVSGFLVAHP